MKTLISPDVHERCEELIALMNLHVIKKFDRRVFIGDWFDSFEHTAQRSSMTVKLLEDLADDPTDLMHFAVLEDGALIIFNADGSEWRKS